jgi:CPA2 family monovalent cation:H+ antiporter-2
MPRSMVSELHAVVIVLSAGLVTAWLLRFLRAPAMIGFLCAGMIIGPGLHLIDEHRIQSFAELGLILLLFSVGLELSPEPLLRAGRRLSIAGGLQIAATTLAMMVAIQILHPLPWTGALVLAVACAFSSTAIVLTQLSQRGETDSPAGVLITGLLLFQDIAVMVVMALLPAPGVEEEPGRLDRLFPTILSLAVLAALTIAARYALPFIVNTLFRRGGREWMTLFAVLMAVLGAWLATLANWSPALGAFIAGLLLAQTDLRHQLHAEITPFRDTFNALFFISIGMLVDLTLVTSQPALLLAMVFGALIVKGVIGAAATIAAGWSLRLGIVAGIGLCTISEFSYVLAREAATRGIIPSTAMPLFVTWTVGTMLVGAMLVPLSGRLALFIADRVQTPAHRRRIEQAASHTTLRGHVIIVGYGVNGANLARVLRATGIPHCIVELNRRRVLEEVRKGTPVVIGDGIHRSILDRAGLPAARALVIVIADDTATRQIVAQARVFRSDLYIVARTRYIRELELLRRLGANLVIPEEFETSIEIFAHVLRTFGIPMNVIDQQVAIVRAEQYGMLRGHPADRVPRAELLRALEQTTTQTYLLLEGSPAIGRTIAALDFRNRTGATIVAITRQGRPIPNPPADLRFELGDVLVLVGAHAQIEKARSALDPPV